LIAANDASFLSKVAPITSYNSGMNVSKAIVDAAESAGKSKFSTGEAVASAANFIASITASSNQSTASGLLNGSTTYWQSSGPTGSHYFDIEMKSGVLASTVGLVVDTSDESYCPAELTVAVAKDKASLSKSPVHPVAHNFAMSPPGQKFMFALLDNEDPNVRFVRIGIRRCISGGQDTRVRGIIVRGSCGAAEIKLTNPSTAAGSDNLFSSLDVSLVWIQSITEGILHDLHYEGSCNFAHCNQDGEEKKDVAVKVRHVFNRALHMSSKYFGPVSSQEDDRVRNVRYICCRNAILRIIPEALKNFWRPNFDISNCLTAATTGVCASAMLSPLANSTEKTCQNDFESLILFADCIAQDFSSEQIRSTILHAVQGFIGENLLRAALLQHALRTCASSLWDQNFTQPRRQPVVGDSSCISDLSRETLEISGASGPSAIKINGVFDATEELSGGQRVYVKRDDPSICVHFWEKNSQWVVAAASDKGKNHNGWACKSGGLDSASSLSTWKVLQNSQQVWAEQPGVQVRAVSVSSSSSIPKLSSPIPKPIDSSSQLLVPWRGADSRNHLSTLPLSAKFHDFSTLRGPEFRRDAKHGYYEIEVIKELQYPQFGFCTPAFKKSSYETKNGCGDDTDSWYDPALFKSPVAFHF
jgi:hypothetical protein